MTFRDPFQLQSFSDSVTKYKVTLSNGGYSTKQNKVKLKKKKNTADTGTYLALAQISLCYCCYTVPFLLPQEI